MRLKNDAEAGAVAVETALSMIVLLMIMIGSVDLSLGLWLRSGLRHSALNFARRASIQDVLTVRGLSDDCEIIEGLLATRAAAFHRQQLAGITSPVFQINLQNSASSGSWYLMVAAKEDAPCLLCRLAGLNIKIHGSSVERIESRDFSCATRRS